MTFEGHEYAFALLDLPTILETYKTYNDSDLVKSNDIGQVRTALKHILCMFSRRSHKQAPHRLLYPESVCIFMGQALSLAQATFAQPAFL